MINKLGFFGFLGALGLLGFCNGQSAYFGFFGFCAYFYYFTVVPDEMFRENVRRSASTGFFVLTAAAGVGLCAAVLAQRMDWAGPAFALAFAAAVFTFSLRMAVQEFREAWGTRS